MKKLKKILLGFKFIGGSVIVLAGLALMLFGNSLQNPMIIVIGIAITAGGGFLIKSAWGIDDRRVQDDRKTPAFTKENPANTVVIRKDSVKFENVYEPPGQSKKCYNDGKFYHVLIEEGNKLVPFSLPDVEETALHYDPAEFGNVVTMPLNKQYFSWSDNLMQKVSLAIMGIVIGAELIMLIIFAG